MSTHSFKSKADKWKKKKKHINQIRCLSFIYNSTFQLLYCDIIDPSILSPVATFINNSKLSLSKYYVRHY